MSIATKLAALLLLTIALFVPSAANTKVKKREGGPLKRSEIKEAETRLREMGYRLQALTTFQKWE
jgi:hypothetical protein